MPCLTTLDQFKDFLGLTSTDEDAQLRAILDSVEQAVESWCRRKFKSATYTEYHDGHGQKLLILEHRPLTEITGVWVDSQGYYGHGANAFAGATDEWTLGTDFVPKRLDESESNGSLLVALKGLGLGSGYWPLGEGNIKVTYTAGYAAIPEDLILAVHQLGQSVRNAAEKGVVGTMRSETQGRYTYELITGDGQNAGDISGQDIAQVRGILKRYREAA